jgi:hypothetical protein
MTARPGAPPVIGVMIVYAGCLLVAGIIIGLWIGG